MTTDHTDTIQTVTYTAPCPCGQPATWTTAQCQTVRVTGAGLTRSEITLTPHSIATWHCGCGS